MIPPSFVQMGERKVEGVELGIVGKLTETGNFSAGVAKMDTEIVQGLRQRRRARRSTGRPS